MKVYLIRHGQSEFNALGIHQGRDSTLSRHGIAQARALARRLAGLSVRTVLTSDHERASSTARIVAGSLRARVVEMPELGEWKNPSEIIGTRHGDPLAAHISKARMRHYHDKAWHYSDEENAADVIRRARRVVAMLEGRRGKAVVVVTHSGFIRAIVGVMLFGRGFGSRQLLWLHQRLRIENTGITEVELTAGGDGAAWRLITWNDVAHLG